MKDNNNTLIGIIILIIVSVIAICIYGYSQQIDVPMKARIVTHNVTADKNGHRTYSTIVLTEDDMLEEVTGLHYYVAPVGSDVNYVATRTKKNEQH